MNENILTISYELDSIFFEEIEGKKEDKEHKTRIEEGKVIFEYKNGEMTLEDSTIYNRLINKSYL
ncbi:MAG: hypothetical protein GY827_01080 [Cytophagales bacterium]|nr:hypothetical protein [Cytophagales bacterium]